MSHPRLPDPSLFRQSLPVERRRTLTHAEFEAQFSDGAGYPIVLTDIVPAWPAFQKWAFNFFADRYGEEDVLVSDQLRRPIRTFRMKLRAFLDFCHSSGEPGFEHAMPLYLGFQPFSKHFELLADFNQPSFADCIYESNNKNGLYAWYVEQFGVILIGSKGTVTTLHVDLFGTHNWLAQIYGRKHWLLFAPGDAGHLEDGTFDLFNPGPATASKLRNAQPYEVILEPGELIFVPEGWYHHVVSLTPSISLSFNFVNETNLLAHLLGMSRDWPQWSNRLRSLELKMESRAGSEPAPV